MDWEAIRDQARLTYSRVAQLLLFLQLVLYLVACGIAEKPIGPKAFVQFTYHMIQWSPNRAQLVPPVYDDQSR
jgi:hypothetical protein